MTSSGGQEESYKGEQECLAELGDTQAHGIVPSQGRWAMGMTTGDYRSRSHRH